MSNEVERFHSVLWSEWTLNFETEWYQESVGPTHVALDNWMTSSARCSLSISRWAFDYLVQNISQYSTCPWKSCNSKHSTELWSYRALRGWAIAIACKYTPYQPDEPEIWFEQAFAASLSDPSRQGLEFQKRWNFPIYWMQMKALRQNSWSSSRQMDIDCF